MNSDQKDAIQIGGKKVSLNGRFRLTSNKPAEKMTLTNIDSFVPYGKSIEDKVYFYNQQGKANFLLIDRKVTFLNPDESDIDAKNIKTLIMHEDVRLEDMTEEQHANLVEKNIKKANPSFTLVNIDKASIDVHKDNVEMIEIDYLITKRKDPLSKKKLMYICGALGIPTRSNIKDEVRYIAFLQDTLSKHLRANKSDRINFTYFYEKISDAEVLYFIKEFEELGYIKNFGGIYKIDDTPVGFKISDVKEWLISNEEQYESLKLKTQEFHNGKVTA